MQVRRGRWAGQNYLLPGSSSSSSSNKIKRTAVRLRHRQLFRAASVSQQHCPAGRTPPWITTTWPASYHSRQKISLVMYKMIHQLDYSLLIFWIGLFLKWWNFFFLFCHGRMKKIWRRPTPRAFGVPISSKASKKLWPFIRRADDGKLSCPTKGRCTVSRIESSWSQFFFFSLPRYFYACS